MMKWFQVSVGVAFLFAFLMGGVVAPGPAHAGTGAATLGITLQVGGMSCSACAQEVQASLLQMPGVKSAEVSLARNEAKVHYEAKEVTPEQLVMAVKEAGFEAYLKKP